MKSMRATTVPLERLIRGRAVFLAVHAAAFLHVGLRSLRARVAESLALPPAWRPWIVPLLGDTLPLLVFVIIAYACLLPLVRALTLAGVPSRGAEVTPSTRRPLRWFGILPGDPWWLVYLMTAPTVFLVTFFLTVIVLGSRHVAAFDAVAMSAGTGAVLLYAVAVWRAWGGRGL